MAEPWLKTISPPNNNKTNNIGSNQYFFLIFKNSQNSIKKSIIKLLKLIFHFTFNFRSFNPVCFFITFF